ATVLTLAAHFGMPVSTTHSISTAIMGVGFAKNPRALKIGVIERIARAWITTIPAAGGLAWLRLRGMKAIGWACGAAAGGTRKAAAGRPSFCANRAGAAALSFAHAGNRRRRRPHPRRRSRHPARAGGRLWRGGPPRGAAGQGAAGGAGAVAEQ